MKNFFALLIFAAVMAGGAWYFYTKNTNQFLTGVGDQVEQLEKRVASRRAEAALTTAALEAKAKAEASRKALAILVEQQRSLADQEVALKREKEKMTTAARQSLVGTVLDTVTLPDGRKLDQARVMKVDDTGVTLTTPSGVVRVLPHEFTPELRQYFGYNR